LGPFEDPDFFPFLFPEQQLMRLAFGPPVVRSPTDLPLRQMIAPPDFGMMGLTNDAFLFSHALRGQMIGIPGAAGLPYMDLGMPFSFGTMSPFGGGSPVDRLLSGGMRPGRAVPQFNPYYPSPLLPQAGRYSIGMTGGRGFNPFNLGAPMMPGIPGLRGGGLIQPWNAPYLPARRRIVSIGQAPQPAPKPVAVKSLTDAERKVLQAFANDLAGVVEAARKKEWPKLDSAINKITALRDLPDVLGADLKELAAAATEIAVGQSVIDVLKLGANMEREYARKNPEGLARHGIATRSNALIAPLIADHIDCRAFDLQVTAADVEGVQKLVARIAEGAPAKKENNASAAAVEELLGRPLTGVETLLWLHMRADHRSAQDIAAELRKSR
jgi:hypothetical protein